MPKKFTSKTQKIGEIGEDIAVRFLMKHGFVVLERNYTKKWGEIDVIAEKDGKLYFIEVKSVSRSNLDSVVKSIPISAMATNRHETSDYRPEDNMHPWKLKRMARTIQTYLLSKKYDEEKEWQVDLLIVYLDLEKKTAKTRVVRDIVL